MIDKNGNSLMKIPVSFSLVNNEWSLIIGSYVPPTLINNEWSLTLGSYVPPILVNNCWCENIYAVQNLIEQLGRIYQLRVDIMK